MHVGYAAVGKVTRAGEATTAVQVWPAGTLSTVAPTMR
jgi:hypothetical protein